MMLQGFDCGSTPRSRHTHGQKPEKGGGLVKATLESKRQYRLRKITVNIFGKRVMISTKWIKNHPDPTKIIDAVSDGVSCDFS